MRRLIVAATLAFALLGAAGALAKGGAGTGVSVITTTAISSTSSSSPGGTVTHSASSKCVGGAGCTLVVDGSTSTVPGGSFGSSKVPGASAFGATFFGTPPK